MVVYAEKEKIKNQLKTVSEEDNGLNISSNRNTSKIKSNEKMLTPKPTIQIDTSKTKKQSKN